MPSCTCLIPNHGDPVEIDTATEVAAENLNAKCVASKEAEGPAKDDRTSVLNMLITLTIPPVEVSECLENPAGTYPPNLASCTLPAEATCGEKLLEEVTLIMAVPVIKTGKAFAAANDRLGPPANCAPPLHPGVPDPSSK